MTVKYKVVKTAQPGVTGGGTYKYYPRVTKRTKMGLKELAKSISDKCTLHESDIHATLIALVKEIPNLLLDNYLIELGDLGIFSLHINGKPADTPEEVTTGKIRNVKVAFRAGKDIKRELRMASFTADK
jgi:predicted histone-like DNA-binding protein